MTSHTTRRIVTGHDSQGKAIFDSDEILTAVNPFKSDGSLPSGTIPGFTTICKTEGIPAKIQGPFTDHHGSMIPLTDSSGAVCRIVDFPPLPENVEDKDNIMHRTQSVDFGAVLEGSIELILDDGEVKTMNQGDIVVQRATVHHWKNVSGKNCRILFVLIPSLEVKNETTGEILEPTNTSRLVKNQDAN